MPDWDSTERNDSDEDARWRDLVARFDSPLAAEEPVPWPEREEAGAAPADAAPPEIRPPENRSPENAPPENVPPPPPSHIVIVPARIVPPPTPRTDVAEADDDHYVPPPPPPLPKLDSLTKAAWAALFGGPGYLLVATAAGWTMPAVAVFAAVAAFVAGVALLVFKLTDSDRDDPDDDGAVV